MVLFLVVYAILAFFLTRYAGRIEKKPQSSAVFMEDQSEKGKYGTFQLDTDAINNPRIKKAVGDGFSNLVYPTNALLLITLT